MINFNNEWLDKPYPELTDEQLLAVANVYQQWHDEEGHRSCVYMLALRSQLAAERERAARAEKALLVPGEMRCAKCNFGLIRTNLYVNNGTTGPGSNETEPCPNGCGPLWPETWEHSAREAWSRLETMHAELTALRERVARPMFGVTFKHKRRK